MLEAPYEHEDDDEGEHHFEADWAEPNDELLSATDLRVVQEGLRDPDSLTVALREGLDRAREVLGEMLQLEEHETMRLAQQVNRMHEL